MPTRPRKTPKAPPEPKTGDAEVTLPVEGMTCASCVRRVEKALLPEPVGTQRVGEYKVTLASDVVAEGEASLAFDVSRNGRPVEDLEPYLGALGHLVALREGDLAFLHVHPEAEEGSGPRIAFRAAFPSSGRYRLFLQFAHRGRVQTAAFTIEA